MKKIALFFVVGAALVSCGKKGWDAEAEKSYLDKCKGGVEMLASQCDCQLKTLKEAGVAPDKVDQVDAATALKMAGCLAQTGGDLLNGVVNGINDALKTVDSTLQNTTVTVPSTTTTTGGH